LNTFLWKSQELWFSNFSFNIIIFFLEKKGDFITLSNKKDGLVALGKNPVLLFAVYNQEELLTKLNFLKKKDP